jgi:hypothetical protein
MSEEEPRSAPPPADAGDGERARWHGREHREGECAGSHLDHVRGPRIRRQRERGAGVASEDGVGRPEQQDQHDHDRRRPRHISHRRPQPSPAGSRQTRRRSREGRDGVGDRRERSDDGPGCVARGGGLRRLTGSGEGRARDEQRGRRHDIHDPQDPTRTNHEEQGDRQGGHDEGDRDEPWTRHECQCSRRRDRTQCRPTPGGRSITASMNRPNAATIATTLHVPEPGSTSTSGRAGGWSRTAPSLDHIPDEATHPDGCHTDAMNTWMGPSCARATPANRGSPREGRWYTRWPFP